MLCVGIANIRALHDGVDHHSQCIDKLLKTQRGNHFLSVGPTQHADALLRCIYIHGGLLPKWMIYRCNLQPPQQACVMPAVAAAGARRMLSDERPFDAVPFNTIPVTLPVSVQQVSSNCTFSIYSGAACLALVAHLTPHWQASALQQVWDTWLIVNCAILYWQHEGLRTLISCICQAGRSSMVTRAVWTKSIHTLMQSVCPRARADIALHHSTVPAMVQMLDIEAAAAAAPAPPTPEQLRASEMAVLQQADLVRQLKASGLGNATPEVQRQVQVSHASRCRRVAAVPNGHVSCCYRCTAPVTWHVMLQAMLAHLGISMQANCWEAASATDASPAC